MLDEGLEPFLAEPVANLLRVFSRGEGPNLDAIKVVLGVCILRRNQKDRIVTRFQYLDQRFGVLLVAQGVHLNREARMYRLARRAGGGRSRPAAGCRTRIRHTGFSAGGFPSRG
jgi:hypothetical protein